MNKITIPYEDITDDRLEGIARDYSGLEGTLAQALLETREALRQCSDALLLEESRAISSELEARHDRDRARLRTVLSLLGVSRAETDEICAKMADAIKANPDGILVFTHNSEVRTFNSLVAMFWQDDEHGEHFNELLWRRS